MTRTTRPVALTRHGMVSSPHYLASVAGMRVLQEGGSATDAAIAVNAALGVVYPHMTGMGGDAFWLIYDAPSGRVHALNGSGRASSKATRQFFRAEGYEEIPSRGPLAAVTVPGAVDSWCAAHEWFGRLPLRQALGSAISYARDGYPVSGGQAHCTEEVADVLNQHSATRRGFLPEGRPPLLGEVMRFPELAETIETVAEKGREGFYEGPVAEEIARSVQDEGGILSAEDLASQRSDWVDPISTTYRGLTCYQHPPNSQGFAHLMMLNILEGFDLHSMGEDSADYLHLLVEATKAVFVDRDRYLTDPEFADIPLEQLLSKEYAAELRASIDMNRSRSPAATKSPAGDTTYSAVVDAEGNAASVIQSLYYECGSAFVAGGSGVCLQNRGSFFSLDEEQTNRLEPGKRTFHTLMPGMLFQDGLPSMIYGTMGGEGQPQTQTALVTRTVDFGHDIQSAIDRPRWLYGRTWGETTSDLRVESRIPEAVVSMLRARNHPVRVVEEWSDAMGHAQGIVLDHERSVLMGGADPRGEGIAIGW